MGYIISRADFLGKIEPMISVIEQGGHYIATGDRGHVCANQDIEELAREVAGIITHSLQLAWPEKKVRVRFVGKDGEAVDFWIKIGWKDDFSIMLKSEEPKGKEAPKFFKVFCA
jgi:hypothetical protein